MTARYLLLQTHRAEDRALAGLQSLEAWQERRNAYRQQLLEMLGLDPMPPRTDLRATITGRLEAERFAIEKIHFQSRPGLYVSANLYLPRGTSGPAPAILYLCGHSRVAGDGVSFGNKVAYQHHPAWFAENGYVAMILDTLDLGEIAGEHHGTSRRGWWWWPSRGYTPAGVETWNAIRALDYLSTRPEVDMERIGVTGRSGGGAYTWFLAGVDDRPSVLVPVAGITDLRNHVVDGAIEGHCDCMYPANIHAWDFTILAALSAPRPLLLTNTDKDRIFPLDGVLRIHESLAGLYRMHGAAEKLGLLIAEGPHRDIQELQVAAFRWMNRWLKGEEGPVPPVASGRFEPGELKVLTDLPADEVNTRIHDTFVPAATVPPIPASRADWRKLAGEWKALLRERVFNGWPGASPSPTGPGLVSDVVREDVRVRVLEYRPDDAYRLRAVVLTRAGTRPAELSVRLLDAGEIPKWDLLERRYFPGLTGGMPVTGGAAHDPDEILAAVRSGVAVALVMPRGVGPTAWPEAKDTHIRRRYLLLGQSLEAMQVWDVRAAVAALRSIPDLSDARVSMHGSRTMALVALFAAIFEENTARLELTGLASTLAGGPAIPNVLRHLDVPQLLAMALPRAIQLSGATAGEWRWSLEIARLLEAELVVQ